MVERGSKPPEREVEEAQSEAAPEISPETQRKLDSLVRGLRTGFPIPDLSFTREDFEHDLVKQELADAAVVALRDAVRDRRWLNGMLPLLKAHPFPEDTFSDPRVDRAVHDIILNELQPDHGTYLPAAADLARLLHVSPEVLTAPDIQERLRQRILKEAQSNTSYQTMRYVEDFPVSEEVLQLPDVQQAAERWMFVAFMGSRIQDAWKIAEGLRVPEERRAQIALGAIRDSIITGKPYAAMDVHERFPLDGEEVAEHVAQGAMNLLRRARFSEARQALDMFGVDVAVFRSEEGRQASAFGIVELYANDDQEAAERMVKEFAPSESELALAARETIIGLLHVRALEHVEKVLLRVPLPKKDLDDAYSQGMAFALENDMHPIAAELNRRLGYPDKTLTQCEELFGDFVTKEAYEHVVALSAYPDAAERINALRQELRAFTDECLSEEGPLPDRLSKSPVLAAHFKSLTRFVDAEWGSHDEEDFTRIVTAYRDARGEVEPLPEGLEPSAVLRIAKIDAEKAREYKPTKEAAARYEAFRAGTEEALRLVDEPERLAAFLAAAQAKRDELVEALRQKSPTLPPQARDAVLARITALESVDFTLQGDLQQPFATLARSKEFDHELRTMTLLASLRFRPEQIPAAREHVGRTAPRREDFSWALNFIDHITNKETLRQFFTDRAAADAFKKLLNVTALEDEMRRVQDVDTKGTMAMQFVPQRNLLTEFSGHIGDACWASAYRSILKEFPNISSLTMVTNPEDAKTRRLAGSALLIETDAQDGTPLLVIRGLNPQENIINQLSPKDFVDKLTRYLSPLAEKMGRKLAIVIDRRSGGAGTNRPVLFSHLEERRKTLTKLPLASAEDTTFNDYVITDDTYLIG